MERAFKYLRRLHIHAVFEPLQKTERTSSEIKNGIRKQLEIFAEKGKMFLKSAINNGIHVGSFNNQIYLFDLGDLIDMNDPLDDDDDYYCSVGEYHSSNTNNNNNNNNNNTTLPSETMRTAALLLQWQNRFKSTWHS